MTECLKTNSKVLIPPKTFCTEKSKTINLSQAYQNSRVSDFNRDHLKPSAFTTPTPWEGWQRGI